MQDCQQSDIILNSTKYYLVELSIIFLMSIQLLAHLVAFENVRDMNLFSSQKNPFVCYQCIYQFYPHSLFTSDYYSPLPMRRPTNQQYYGYPPIQIKLIFINNINEIIDFYSLPSKFWSS